MRYAVILIIYAFVDLLYAADMDQERARTITLCSRSLITPYEVLNAVRANGSERAIFGATTLDPRPADRYRVNFDLLRWWH